MFAWLVKLDKIQAKHSTQKHWLNYLFPKPLGVSKQSQTGHLADMSAWSVAVCHSKNPSIFHPQVEDSSTTKVISH